MLFYIARRIAQSVAVLIGVTSIVFLLLHLTGDPAELLLPDRATQAQITELRMQLGLDRPLAIQYGIFLGRAVHGDFGTSIRYNEPAMSLVLAHLGNTALLALVALSIAVAIALPAGTLAAMNRGSILDRGVMAFTLVGYAVPTFWLAIMLILVFSVALRWLPPSGFDSPQQIVLPGLTLGLYEAALLARLLRRGLVDSYAKDFIRTARAKGLSESTVFAPHALKNALIPVITVFGLQAGSLLGGAVITETVFSYPGVGYLLVEAIYQRDFAIVEAFVVVAALIIVGVNLLVDLAYAYLDPRIQYS